MKKNNIKESKIIKIEEILSDVFRRGTIYGEDIHYATDESLYELQKSTMSEAKQKIVEELSSLLTESKREAVEKFVEYLKSFDERDGTVYSIDGKLNDFLADKLVEGGEE